MRRRRAAIFAPLLCLVILWLWSFTAQGALKGGPNGKAFGADWGMFIGAAQVLKDGGNPYDHNLLYRTESKLLTGQGLPMSRQKPIVRVGNPPPFLWALQPLTGKSFQSTAYIWIAALALLSVAGFLGALTYLGWSIRYLPVFLFLLMPQVEIGAFYGNPTGLVFAAVGCSLALARRYPFWAGLLLSLAWIKPPVALPIALLVYLFHAPRRDRLLAGFASATAILLLVTLATTGAHSLSLWVVGLQGYSRDISVQTNVASLAGLYTLWAPAWLRLVFELVLGLAAVTLTASAWRRYPHNGDATMMQVGWLWFVWMLATPYAHFFDEMILVVPLLAMFGRDGYRTSNRYAAVSIYLMFFSLFFIQTTPLHVYVLPILLLGVSYCYFRALHDPLYKTDAAPLTAAVAVT
jgi:hypothetical protein